MADKRLLLEQMELESAQLRAQLMEQERLMQEMRAQVQRDQGASSEPRNSNPTAFDKPMDSLTSSFRLMKQTQELQSSSGNAGRASGSSDPQGQVMMSTLLRKASTLARPGGKISVNYKDLMKDLIISDHPGVKVALAKADYDDGKALKNTLESIMMEKMVAEKSAQLEQLARREKLLSGGERSAVSTVAAAVQVKGLSSERKTARDQAQAALLQKKLQRLGATQGNVNVESPSNFVTNGLAASRAPVASTSFSSPPPVPAPAPVSGGTSQHQQQQQQFQNILQQATAKGGGRSSTLFHAPPLPTPSQQSNAGAAVGAGSATSFFGAGGNGLSTTSPDRLTALQQMCLATNRGGINGVSAASDTLGIFGGNFPMPLPPSVMKSEQCNKDAPTSLHLGAGTDGKAMGSKRSRPESTNKITAFRETNRTRNEAGLLEQPQQQQSLAESQRKFLEAKQQALLSQNNFSSALSAQIAGLQRNIRSPSLGISQPTNQTAPGLGGDVTLGSAAASTFTAAFDQIQGLSTPSRLGALSLVSSQLPPASTNSVAPGMEGTSVLPETAAAKATNTAAAAAAAKKPVAARPDIAINTREYIKSNTPSAAPRRWTSEEDQQLREAVERHNAKNWKAIAEEVPGRNNVQCLQRWRKALDPGVVKGHWTVEEDQRLIELAGENPKNWGHVAKGIAGRTAKQCRERYHNHLDPSIKKGDWTPDEDKIIIARQKELGNKWAQIAQFLEGRTENSVKIRWKSIQRFNAGGGAAIS